jgi:hypothetical protein
MRYFNLYHNKYLFMNYLCEKGTETLVESLKIHPNVKIASGEVRYFDYLYKKGLEWYMYVFFLIIVCTNSYFYKLCVSNAT